MTADPTPAERPENATHFGGDGLYQSYASEDAAPLKVQLGEHLDSVTKQSLQGAISTVDSVSAGSALDFVKRHPLPLLLALAGAIWFWTSRRRRS